MTRSRQLTFQVARGLWRNLRNLKNGCTRCDWRNLRNLNRVAAGICGIIAGICRNLRNLCRNLRNLKKVAAGIWKESAESDKTVAGGIFGGICGILNWLQPESCFGRLIDDSVVRPQLMLPDPTINVSRYMSGHVTRWGYWIWQIGKKYDMDTNWFLTTSRSAYRVVRI